MRLLVFITGEVLKADKKGGGSEGQKLLKTLRPIKTERGYKGRQQKSLKRFHQLLWFTRKSSQIT